MTDTLKSHRPGKFKQISTFIYILPLVAIALMLALNWNLYREAFGTKEMLVSLSDAQEYYGLGKALLGYGEPPVWLFEIRGYFYPLLAASATNVSPVLILAIQILSVAAGIMALAMVERTITGRLIWSPFALLSVSLLLSPASLMTESISFGLSSIAILCLVRGAPQAGAIALLAAGMVKTVFLPLALLLLLISAKRSFYFVCTVGVFFAILLPQFFLSEHVLGRSKLPSAGSFNFEMRFFPAVYGVAEQHDGIIRYNSQEAAEIRQRFPNLAEKIKFVLSHPFAAVKAWAIILESHLTAPSGFAQGDNVAATPTVASQYSKLSSWLNPFVFALGAIGLFGVLRRCRQTSIFGCFPALIAGFVIATAPLVYWQGDRVVFLGFLLMLPFVGWALRPVSSEIPRRFFE